MIRKKGYLAFIDLYKRGTFDELKITIQTQTVHDDLITKSGFNLIKLFGILSP